MLIATLAAVLAISAMAPRVGRAEFSLSAYAGAAIPPDSDVSTSAGSGEMDLASSHLFGARAGYWFTRFDMPYLGIQIDLNGHFPDVDKIKSGSTVSDVENDMSVVSTYLNLLLRYPGDVLLRPYAGAGVGLNYADMERGTISASVLGLSSGALAADDDSAFGWQVLAGLEHPVTPGFSIFAEYSYGMAYFEFETSGLELDYRVSKVYTGLSIMF